MIKKIAEFCGLFYDLKLLRLLISELANYSQKDFFFKSATQFKTQFTLPYDVYQLILPLCYATM